MFRNLSHIISVVLTLSLLTATVKAQSVSFEIKTSPNVQFDFTTVNHYLTGVTSMNAIQLNVEATEQWDLYVGTTTDAPGLWNAQSFYALNGEVPPVSILQLRARNSANTTLASTFLPLRDISNPVYIIGSSAKDPIVNCPNAGANAPGNYLTSPNCYRFNIDLKVVPGLNYRPGLYELRVDYIIVQDL